MVTCVPEEDDTVAVVHPGRCRYPRWEEMMSPGRAAFDPTRSAIPSGERVSSAG